MAQKQGVVIENTFGKGFVTEATGLNFPKDAAVDTDNCVWNTDMSIDRRLGFNLEDSATSINSVFIDGVISTYLWKNVANIPDKTLTVIQVGTILNIYDNVDPHSLSNNLLFSLNLDSFSGAGTTRHDRCQFAEGLGYLFVAHPLCDPFYISYKDGVFSTTRIVLQIRDFDGVDDGLGPDQRPSTLSTSHGYNLYNQGWYAYAPSGSDPDAIGPSAQVMGVFAGGKGVYPSNADYWWASKDGIGQFNTKLIDSVPLGNNRAPRGHYILYAFYQDRGLAASVSGIPVVTTGTNKPSCIQFFAGRAWYAGVEYNTNRVNFSNKIYFSRIIETNNHMSQCYQDGDPTSENGADLLPSDGGVISIPEMGTIHKMVPMGYSLIVFASNGIWTISGSQGIGFTATDYTISKVSSEGSLSAHSFVDINGTPIWWTLDSINTLGAGGSSNTGSGLSVQSLTDEAIKSFYRKLPDNIKYTVVGTFNKSSNQIIYLYKSTDFTTVEESYQYDKALVFNVLTKAWYKWSLPANYKLCGIETVVSKANAGTTKYLTRNGPGSYTFSECRSTDYLDYGTDYLSFVDTGYALGGEGVAKFYVPYLYVYLKNGSLYVYAKWNFANSPDTGKFSTKQRVYANSLYDYQTVRKRIRGSGRSVVFRYESETGVPFNLIGWAAGIGVNGGP